MLDIFDGPTPGQSLTKEVGSLSVEHPAQHADPNAALEELFDKLTTPKQATRLVLMLKKGVPVEYIARAVLFEGFLQNKWTPDMAMLMLRIVMAMIISIGVRKGISPTIFNEDTEHDKFLDQFIDMEIQEEVANDSNNQELDFNGFLGVGV